MAARQQVFALREILEKNEALAICFRNLKGTKTKDLLLTARALQFLRNLPECSSNKSVGEAVGVSGEIVRQFIILLELPSNILPYFEQRILGLEQGRRLWQLNRKRPAIVEDAARAMSIMTAMEARDLVEYLIRTPLASVQDSLAALEAAKPEVSHEYHIDAILDEQAYCMLVVEARRKRLRVNDLVTNIVNGWLADNSDIQQC